VLSIWRGFLLFGLRRKGSLFTHLSQRLSSAVLPFGVPIDEGNSLCPAQEKRTMREAEVQIGNSGYLSVNFLEVTLSGG
jgi:hypothetical protein